MEEREARDIAMLRDSVVNMPTERGDIIRKLRSDSSAELAGVAGISAAS